MAVTKAAFAPTAPPVPAPPPGATLVRQMDRAAAIFAFCRRNPLVLVGASVVLLWIVVSTAAPLVSPYGPLAQKVVDRLHTPSLTHPFGTDALGRDLLSRV